MDFLYFMLQNEWVICRVFHKKTELIRTDSGGGGGSISLPPLMESPAAYGGKNINPNIPESVHVPCFSNTTQIQTTQKDMISNLLNNPIFPFESNSNLLLEQLQSDPIMHQFPSGSSFPACDQSILRGLIGTYGHGLKVENEMVTGSQDTGVSSEKNIEISSCFEKGIRGIEDQEAPPIDLDCLWNY